MQIYPNAYLYFDNQLAAESVSIESGLEGDDSMALSIVDGFKGLTPSARTRTVKATFLVPSGGFEFPYEAKFRNNEVVTCGIQVGDKTCISKGFFMNAVSISAGIGKNTEVTIDFRGEPTGFE